MHTLLCLSKVRQQKPNQRAKSLLRLCGLMVSCRIKNWKKVLGSIPSIGLMLSPWEIHFSHNFVTSLMLTGIPSEIVRVYVKAIDTEHLIDSQWVILTMQRGLYWHETWSHDQRIILWNCVRECSTLIQDHKPPLLF